MKLHLFVLAASFCAAADLNCDLNDYKWIDGLSAELRGETLEVVWSGERGEQLRAGFVIRTGQPLVSDHLGFVYYRKDSENSFAVGVRQADREEPYRPYGVSDEEWEKREHEAA